MLASLGTLDDAMTIATPSFTSGAHGTGKEIVGEIEWAEGADASPSTPYARPVSVHQSVFKKCSTEALKKLGTNVELGVESVSIEQNQTIRQSYLRGD